MGVVNIKVTTRFGHGAAKRPRYNPHQKGHTSQNKRE